jgi:ribosomal protein S18 acetylase RimI-like enzyme
VTRVNEAGAGARIRRAAATDAAALTSVARISKAVWGFDAGFMAACRAELTVRAASIRRGPTYLVEADGRILGFYQLRIHGALGDISMIFVAPEALRTGLGRRLWAHLEATARAAGATRLEVDSDSHAEGFYSAMGMRRVGEAASGSIPGRMLPHLAKELGPESSVVPVSPGTAVPAAGGIQPCSSDTTRLR